MASAPNTPSLQRSPPSSMALSSWWRTSRSVTSSLISASPADTRIALPTAGGRWTRTGTVTSGWNTLRNRASSIFVLPATNSHPARSERCSARSWSTAASRSRTGARWGRPESRRPGWLVSRTSWRSPPPSSRASGRRPRAGRAGRHPPAAIGTIPWARPGRWRGPRWTEPGRRAPGAPRWRRAETERSIGTPRYGTGQARPAWRVGDCLAGNEPTVDAPTQKTQARVLLSAGLAVAIILGAGACSKLGP